MFKLTQNIEHQAIDKNSGDMEKSNSSIRTLCCICKKVKEGKNWADSSVDIKEIVSHGYCPECYKKLEK